MKTWQDLPSEMKEKVVFHCTPFTRSSLNVCSKLEHQLVKNVCSKKIERVDIKMTAEELSIECFEQIEENKTSFKTFDELQAAILLTMKKVNSIKVLKIISKERSEKSFLNILTAEDRECCRMRKIEEIRIESDIYEEVVDILRQVEPIYLRKVKITSNISKEELYEMPQITNAEEVIIRTSECSMKESQLLNLKARCVKISHINFPVNKFIKKCIVEANVKSAEFDFTFANESLVAELLKDWSFDTIEKLCDASMSNFHDQVMGFVSSERKSQEVLVLETLYPHLKLEMTLDGLTLKGSIVFDSEKTAALSLINDQYMLRVIENLRIQHASTFWRIEVARNRQSSRIYHFESLEEAQEKFDEILENVDYIKNFRISWVNGLLFQPRKKKLMVSWLQVEGGGDSMDFSRMLPNLLDEIEPGYLDHFCFLGTLETKNVFDMPQINHASLLEFDYVFPRDDQILNMRAAKLHCSGVAKDLCLTSSGLNQYMKKCLLDLNVKNYMFSFYVTYEWNEKELFEDLVYTKSQEGEESIFVVKSNFPEHVLVVYICEDDFYAERDLRKNHL